MEPTHKISSKKSGKKKAAMTATRPVIAEIKPEKPFLVITDVHALIITAIVFAIEYTFSFYHTSMYQGEEGVHYMNMKAFWHDPTLVLLGTWAKTGWKIMYALPVLLGKQGVIIMNCLLSSFAAFFCYKTAKLRNVSQPVLAMILLFTQPLWFYLSFKTYSEIPAAFLLILATFLHYKKLPFLAALTLSYIPTIRQEFYPILAIYGLYLLWNKKWLPAFALGVFPFLYNLWGGLVTGDPLYLLHSASAAAERYKDMYPRHGFEHYFLKSYEIYGAVIMTTFVAYVGLALFRKIKVDYFILVPLAIYFLTQCIFNIQTWKIGTSTGGNLRYLLVISPLFAVIGSIAISKIVELKNRYFLLLLLVPMMLAVGKYMSYPPDGVDFNFEVHDWKPLIFIFIISLILVVPIPKKIYTYALLIAPLVFSLITIRPRPLQGDENAAQRDFVEWCKKKKAFHRHFVVSIALFNYFFDKNPWEFEHGQDPVTIENIDKAPVGSIIVWDSHYAMKYGHIENEYLNSQPNKYRGVYARISENNDIAIIAYEKIRR